MTPRVLGVASFLDTWLVLIKACSCLKVSCHSESMKNYLTKRLYRLEEKNKSSKPRKKYCVFFSSPFALCLPIPIKFPLLQTLLIFHLFDLTVSKK